MSLYVGMIGHILYHRGGEGVILSGPCPDQGCGLAHRYTFFSRDWVESSPVELGVMVQFYPLTDILGRFRAKEVRLTKYPLTSGQLAILNRARVALDNGCANFSTIDMRSWMGWGSVSPYDSLLTLKRAGWLGSQGSKWFLRPPPVLKETSMSI